MHAFPKIFALGTDYIKEILDGKVEVTEKVDGSQFGFGMIDGELVCRSKGKIQPIDNPDRMFIKAVEQVVSIQDKLPEGMFFHAEYLESPGHNNLTYDRIPKNHLALFSAIDHKKQKFVSIYEDLKHYAYIFDIDVVPLMYQGEATVEQLEKMLDRESMLGGAEIEGFVVKNYAKPFLLGGQPIPLMAGKFVSEKYKEVAKGWHKKHTNKGVWDTFKQTYKTDARWEKAVQHLRDDGILLGEPKDIGGLIKEVHRDIEEEEIETIKEFLWKEFGAALLRTSTAGLPEWYKKKLLHKLSKKEK